MLVTFAYTQRLTKAKHALSHSYKNQNKSQGKKKRKKKQGCAKGRTKSHEPDLRKDVLALQRGMMED